MTIIIAQESANYLKDLTILHSLRKNQSKMINFLRIMIKLNIYCNIRDYNFVNINKINQKNLYIFLYDII